MEVLGLERFGVICGMTEHTDFFLMVLSSFAGICSSFLSRQVKEVLSSRQRIAIEQSVASMHVDSR